MLVNFLKEVLLLHLYNQFFIGGLLKMEEENKSCGCGCEEMSEEEMSVEEMLEDNNIVLNTLIDLLIEKKIISEEEFMTKLNSMENEADAEDSEEKDEE